MTPKATSQSFSSWKRVWHHRNTDRYNQNASRPLIVRARMTYPSCHNQASHGRGARQEGGGGGGGGALDVLSRWGPVLTICLPAMVTVPAPTELALRYYRSGNIIWIVEQVLGVALPLALLFSGLSGKMRSFAAGLTGGRFYPTLLVYLVLFALLTFVVELPLSYYVGYARAHAYGLSTQRLGKWAGDQLKGLGVGVIVGALVLWVPYLLLARSPERWWLWS